MKALFFLCIILRIIAPSSLISVFSLINAGASPYFSENSVGKAMISLGKSHKSRYFPLFSAEYNHSDLLISSCPKAFCIKAAYFYAKGLYNQRKTALLPENFPKERAWPPFETFKETKQIPSSVENKEIVPVHSGFRELCERNSNISKENWGKTLILAGNVLNSVNFSEKWENYTDLLRICGEILEKSYRNDTIEVFSLEKLVVFKEMLLLMDERRNLLRVLKQLQENLQGNSKRFSVFFGEETEISSLIYWLNASNVDCLRDFIEKNGQMQRKCAHNFSKIASFITFETYLKENNEKFVKIVVNYDDFSEFLLEELEKLVAKEIKFSEEFDFQCEFGGNFTKNNKNKVKNKKLQEQESEIEKNYKFITALIIIEGFLLILVSGLIYFRKRNRI